MFLIRIWRCREVTSNSPEYTDCRTDGLLIIWIQQLSKVTYLGTSSVSC